MVRRGSPETADVLNALRPDSDSSLLAAMENDRIALYCRVLKMQYAAAAHARNADQFAEMINTQRREIDNLRHEIDVSAAAHQMQLLFNLPVLDSHVPRLSSRCAASGAW